MNKKTKQKLEKRGWEVGGVREFLNLSEEDIKLIEVRIALGKILNEQRIKNGYTQLQLAREIKSSQSRVAKMENGDNSVTIDLLLKCLLHLQTPKSEICKAFARV